jgi:hypothetical protein
VFRPVYILLPQVGGPNSVARKLINLILSKLGVVAMNAREIAIQRGIEIDPGNGGNEDA